MDSGQIFAEASLEPEVKMVRFHQGTSVGGRGHFPLGSFRESLWVGSHTSFLLLFSSQSR